MFARLMGLTTISPRGLHQLMQNEPVTTIDVNSPRSWAEARVPGALNLDVAAFGADDLPRDRDSTLVFYCSNIMCAKAPRAARRAATMGYRHVRVMSAGIRGWLDAALPTESGEGRAG
ncbi:MAG TPA: rhodanese-like domain-containing protein [Vicinamibacterales bacterium]|nr:rhodanese-like domain-containing protein [Vicinamibacterales bacterium]